MAAKYVQFTDHTGARKTIRLPGFTATQTKGVARHVRTLNASIIANLQIDEETARWLAGVKGWLREKLIEVGLLATTEPAPQLSLGAFVRDYMQNRMMLVDSSNLTNSTTKIDQLVVDCLLEFFTPDRDIRDISEGDASDFYDWLLAQGGRPVKRCGNQTVVRARKPLAESTVRKRCSIASKLFRYAEAKRWIEDDPFQEINRGNMAATDNEFINAADAGRVLTQLPEGEWQLLFGLARWAGLRIGSEPRQLKWEHIDFDQQRILIHAPKTKRYADKATRLIPLFPELVPLLQACRSSAVKGDEYVLPMLRGRTDPSLRDPMHRAIRAAELEVWPNLWRSLRSSRQTELEDQGFPTHVVCYWLGNSPKVAAKHYLKIHDQQYAKAVQVA